MEIHGLVFLTLIRLIYDRPGKCKTNKSKFLAGWIKVIILGTWLLSF